VKAENNAATQSLMALVAKKRLELIANAEKDAAKPPPKPSTNPNAGKILTTSITVGDHFNEHTSWDTLRFQMNGEIHRRLKEKCGWHNQYRILDEKESYPKDNNPFSTGRVLRCDVTFECV